MAMFDFVLMGCNHPQRFEVTGESFPALADRIAASPIIVAETPPDEWGEVRRVLVRTSRIQMIVEAQ